MTKTWFTSLPGHEYFCEVAEDFIEDDFNLTGLQGMVPFWKEALEMVLDVEPGMFPPESTHSGYSVVVGLGGCVFESGLTRSLSLSPFPQKRRTRSRFPTSPSLNRRPSSSTDSSTSATS